MDTPREETPSFFDRPNVQIEKIEIGRGIPLGIERISNSRIGIGGAYGAWGESYDNTRLTNLIDYWLGTPLAQEEKMNLSDLGFNHRHLLDDLTQEEHVELEMEVGTRMLREAAQACGWEPSEIEGVLIGVSGPATVDYTEQISKRAGIPESALKVSIHKACDGSVAGLHLALNRELPVNLSGVRNLAEELRGKKILVGGIEGLSRFISMSKDKYALQLFGNGAGVIGIIPGESMKFLTGRTHEVFDEEGVLAVRMFYPHSGQRILGQSMIEVTEAGANHIRVAGLMHEPDSEWPVVMEGPMGMVKLFVRSGVQVVIEAYQAYQAKIEKLGIPDKSIAVAIVHHANLKINKLKEKHLQREGIRLPMPWLIQDFGNVSAASNMIAFLRSLSDLKPGDHVLFDGFGAGTYYDVLTFELGG